MSAPAFDQTDASPQHSDLANEESLPDAANLPKERSDGAPGRPVRLPRRPGSARGLIQMADDFDATPEDLQDYF